MSRTDKDRPYDVRRADSLERRRWSTVLNEWHLDYYHYRTHNTPKWFEDDRWNNPERVRERAELGESRKAWRAGDRDIDFGCWQHRHGAMRDWS